MNDHTHQRRHSRRHQLLGAATILVALAGTSGLAGCGSGDTSTPGPAADVGATVPAPAPAPEVDYVTRNAQEDLRKRAQWQENPQTTPRGADLRAPRAV